MNLIRRRAVRFPIAGFGVSRERPNEFDHGGQVVASNTVFVCDRIDSLTASRFGNQLTTSDA